MALFFHDYRGLKLLLGIGMLFSMSDSAIATLLDQTPSYIAQQDSVSFAKFTPAPSSDRKIDYEYLDFVLDGIIFNLGPSDRVRRVNRHKFNNGKQSITIGHTSPYRLEGSRIYVKRLPGDFASIMADYREELQTLANDLPIMSLSRNEQLTFWLNLHNTAVLELMGQERRARYSKDKRFGPNKVAMHDAKFIEIGGQTLSLRDIREKIVYPNWNNTNVIYGFYLGDIGSPALQLSAFKASTVKAQLQQNAKEFVNSLRGYETFNGKAQVSELYTHASPFFFQDFHRDLKDHFKTYMRPSVFSELTEVSTFTIAPYGYRIGTINAGRSAARPRSIVTNAFDPNSGRLLATVDDILAQDGAFRALSKDYVIKREKLQKQGLWNSDVVIEDIETENNE